MLEFEKIGTYLDREIRFFNIDLLSTYNESIDLSNTLIALYFDNDLNITEVEMFFKKIIEGLPLGIFLAGKTSSKYFDVLLNLLSNFNNESHIMTNISNDDDWLESYLTSTWPTEERFDNWKSYTILGINSFIVKNEIKKYLI